MAANDRKIPNAKAADVKVCGDCHDTRTTERPSPLKSDMMTRLRRVEGQVRGVAQMIENDAYCDYVLHQIAAARSALDAVGKLVLEHHVRSCVVDRIRAEDSAIVEEFLATVKTLLK